jgi:hypothetical protein
MVRTRRAALYHTVKGLMGPVDRAKSDEDKRTMARQMLITLDLTISLYRELLGRAKSAEGESHTYQQLMYVYEQKRALEAVFMGESYVKAVGSALRWRYDWRAVTPDYPSWRPEEAA